MIGIEIPAQEQILVHADRPADLAAFAVEARERDSGVQGVRIGANGFGELRLDGLEFAIEQREERGTQPRR